MLNCLNGGRAAFSLSETRYVVATGEFSGLHSAHVLLRNGKVGGSYALSLISITYDSRPCVVFCADQFDDETIPSTAVYAFSHTTSIRAAPPVTCQYAYSCHRSSASRSQSCTVRQILIDSPPGRPSQRVETRCPRTPARRGVEKYGN